MRFAIALGLTVIVVGGAVAVALAKDLSTSDLMALAQAAGTIGALIWLVYTGLYQADQFKATERATNREVAIQSFELVRHDLEGLMKAIEKELDALGQFTADYERRFANGERTAYVSPLTAGNGFRLRRLVQAPRQRPQLKRMLATYVAIFEPVLHLAGEDADMLSILNTSAHGRVYAAIQAAVAADDEAAKGWSAKLAKLSNWGDREPLETVA